MEDEISWLDLWDSDDIKKENLDDYIPDILLKGKHISREKHDVDIYGEDGYLKDIPYFLKKDKDDFNPFTDEDVDLEDECYIEEDNRYHFRINKKMALRIALKTHNLLHSYCNITNNNSYFSIEVFEKQVDYVEIEDKKYWLVQIVSGKLHSVETHLVYDSFDDINEYFEKEIDDNDKKYLKCLVNVDNGEYIYFMR